MQFEGWVPNATGNVSFSAVGESLTGRVTVRQNFWHPDTRWIVCVEERVNSDRQLPVPVLRLLRLGPVARAENHLMYVMTAKSSLAGGDPEGALNGEIAIILASRPQAAAGLRTASQLSDDLEVAKGAYREGNPYTPPTTQSWGTAQRNIQSAAVFSCKFSMLRNGKSFFEVSDTTSIDPTSMQWLVSQCYYFLKDAVHQHYHHRSKTDAILEVSPVGSTPDWRVKTIRSLYRKVIALRRYLSDDRLSDALGVLAYAKTFSHIFSQKDFGKNGVEVTAPTLHSYSEDLKTSIEIRRETARRSEDRRKADAQFLIGSVIGVVALYAGLYGSFDSKSTAHVIGHKILEILGASPWLLLTPVFMLYVMYSIYTGQKDSANSETVRRLYRLVAWMRRDILITIMLLLVLAFAGGAAVLLKLATKPPQVSTAAKAIKPPVGRVATPIASKNAAENSKTQAAAPASPPKATPAQDKAPTEHTERKP